jgi:outer membrane protein OmpA-like peptidoglycan-associated protein
MNSKLFLPIFLFIVLLLGGSYYYVSKIKQVFPFETKTKKPKTAIEGSLDLVPLAFAFNSEEPVVGGKFENMREDLFAKLGDDDTLMLTGLYYPNEENGEELAASRANNVRMLLSDYFDSTQIMTQVDYDDIHAFDEGQLLPGVSYSVNPYLPDLPIDSTADSVATDSLMDVTGNMDPDGDSDPSDDMVEHIGDKVIIHFPAGSVRKLVTPEVDAYLDKLVAELLAAESYKVYVEGHSDNLGDEATNYQLGRKRAWAVKKLLWDKGLEPINIITSSKGELEPLHNNDTEEGRSYNRRVELTIEKQ